MAEVEIRIRPDGTIEAVTHGLHGDACLPMIPVVQELADAEIVRSHYTAEYYDTREHVQADTPRETERPRVDIGEGE